VFLLDPETVQAPHFLWDWPCLQGKIEVQFKFIAGGLTATFHATARPIPRGNLNVATPTMQPQEPTNPPLQQIGNHKLKIKKPLQRSCNEKDEKGKICGGHLKRWFYAVDKVEQTCGDLERAWGPDNEVYRCEHCKTLYFPNPEEQKTPSVAGRGMLSVFGLTIPPKEDKK
jgi:hypothetical protein